MSFNPADELPCDTDLTAAQAPEALPPADKVMEETWQIRSRVLAEGAEGRMRRGLQLLDLAEKAILDGESKRGDALMGLGGMLIHLS